jgi:pimeloyl-ACP methyl ester carboxylesterase
MTQTWNSKPAMTPEMVKNYRKIEALIPAHWTEGTVEANGIKQHYYRTGGGKPQLILLHGIMTGGITWLRAAKALENNYDVIMPDARGHGRSDGIDGGISYELLAEDLAAFIQTLELEKPALLGHSMGGVTATLVAANHSDWVRCLILEDAVWDHRAGDRMQQLANSEGYMAWFRNYLAYLEGLKTQTHEERLVAALSQLPPGGAALPEDEYVASVEAQAQLDMGLVRIGPALWGKMRLETPMSDYLKRVTCPVLLLTAGRGNTNPQLVAEIIASLPHVQNIRFEEAGHLIHLDQFEQYTGVVETYLKEH